MKKDNLLKVFIISTFVSLYLLVSIVSTIHVIDFFKLTNPDWLAITLAVGFELGASASLASLIVLEKMNKTLIWALFIVITLMQMQGNTYHSFVNINDYEKWSELFNLSEEEPIFQKRILSIVSGAILPLVSLGFIKSLVDYIKPGQKEELSESNEEIKDEPVVDNNPKEEIIEIPAPDETPINTDPVVINTEIRDEIQKSLETQDERIGETGPNLEELPLQENNEDVLNHKDTYNDGFKLPFGENMKNILSHDYISPGMINANSNRTSKTHDSKNNPN